jgi:hypothetical protein
VIAGLKIVGVNGKKCSTNAIADSVTRKKVEFLLEDGDEFRSRMGRMRGEILKGRGK